MSKINIFGLGGLNENGKNMYVIEVDNDIFVFEAGLQYADEHTLGIDYVIPNIDYLKDNVNKIKGIFLTHGHDENIGALPDIIEDLGYPTIYGSKYTLVDTVESTNWSSSREELAEKYHYTCFTISIT